MRAHPPREKYGRGARARPHRQAPRRSRRPTRGILLYRVRAFRARGRSRPPAPPDRGARRRQSPHRRRQSHRRPKAVFLLRQAPPQGSRPFWQALRQAEPTVHAIRRARAPRPTPQARAPQRHPALAVSPLCPLRCRGIHSLPPQTHGAFYPRAERAVSRRTPRRLSPRLWRQTPPCATRQLSQAVRLPRPQKLSRASGVSPPLRQAVSRRRKERHICRAAHRPNPRRSARRRHRPHRQEPYP